MIAARQGFTIFPWIMWDIHMFASRSFSCFHCVTTKINGTTKDRVGSDCFSSPNCFHSRSLYWWNTVVSLCVFHGGVCLFLSRLDRHTWTLQKTITVIQSRIKLNCFCIYSSTHKTVSAQRYAAWFRFYCCFDSAVRCIQQKRRANQKNSFYFEFTLLVVILFSSAVFFCRPHLVARFVKFVVYRKWSGGLLFHDFFLFPLVLAFTSFSLILFMFLFHFFFSVWIQMFAQFHRSIFFLYHNNLFFLANRFFHSFFALSSVFHFYKRKKHWKINKKSGRSDIYFFSRFLCIVICRSKSFSRWLVFDVASAWRDQMMVIESNASAKRTK